MTDTPQDQTEHPQAENPMERFKIGNLDAMRCGPHTWAIQLADGQQLVVQAERVDVSTGVLQVHAQINGVSYDPVALFPPGSWTTAYKVAVPGGPAYALTHLIGQPQAAADHTHEEHSVDDE